MTKKSNVLLVTALKLSMMSSRLAERVSLLPKHVSHELSKKPLINVTLFIR